MRVPMKKLLALLILSTLPLTCLAYKTQAQETAPEQVHANPFAVPAETVAEPAPAPVTPSASVEVMTPSNPQPLEDYTQYYAQQVATVTSASDNKKIGLTYFWFPPEQPWAEGAKFPLVLVLHGASGFAEAGRFLITERTRKQFPAFVVVPALPQGRRWADPGKKKPVHALSEAVELIKQLSAENPVDPARIYVIGCGTGGTGAYGAAQLYSDVFAAAVPIAAEWNPNEISNMKNVPIAAFHGNDDKIVPYLSSNDTITMVQHNGGTAFFTKYDQMKHDCSSPRIYNELLWKWLFDQKKN